MRTEKLFHDLAVRRLRRPDPRDRSSASNDEERLAATLDGVEEFREAPRRFGRTEAPHKIRLSDCSDLTGSRDFRLNYVEQSFHIVSTQSGTQSIDRAAQLLVRVVESA